MVCTVAVEGVRETLLWKESESVPGVSVVPVKYPASPSGSGPKPDRKDVGRIGIGCCMLGMLPDSSL